MADRYLTLPEFAARAGLNPATLRSYRSRGRPAGNPVPPFDRRNPVTGVMEWLVATVDAWIAAAPGQGTRTDLETRP